MPSPTLLLASNSPRRKQLLALGGWEFATAPADMDESVLPGETPREYVMRLAEAKARASAQQAEADQVVVGSDTAVIIDGDILGKPADSAEAESMLRRLRGRTHQVYTGIAVFSVADGKLAADLCITDVPMRDYSDEEIRAYVADRRPARQGRRVRHPASRLPAGGQHERLFLQRDGTAALPPGAPAEGIRHPPHGGPARQLPGLSQVSMSCLPVDFGDRLKQQGETMKRIFTINILLLAALLAGCATANGNVTPGSELPTPEITVVIPPDPASAMNLYLEAMKAEDYATMYAMLSDASRLAVSQEDFAKRHNDAYNEMSLQEMTYDVRSTMTNPNSAEVAYGLNYATALVGELKRDMIASFILEDGQWKLNWDDGLILPELKGGNVLRMSYKIPARGDIYDRDGHAVVTQADAYALGIDPGPTFANPDIYGDMLAVASRLSGKSQDEIANSLIGQQPGWWVPLGEVAAEDLIFSTEYLELAGHSGSRI